MTEPQIGAVLIGRNEGERLVRSLASVKGAIARIVYVDSGSTDGSVAAARDAGAHVVALDLSVPFTAARARNAGLEALLSGGPVDHVQFLDGDCELQSGWSEAALAFLQAHPQAAVACGRLRERFPDASVYNLLCDLEWHTPVGETDACGGIAMIRVAAMQAVGGFDATLIAGEEPELCLRLRRAGWTIHRLPDEMALHDAAMTRFAQFSRRMVRSGWAYAEGAARHGDGPEAFNRREVRRIWLWSVIVPALIVICLGIWAMTGAGLAGALGALGLLAFPAMVFRIARYRRRSFGDPWRQALVYGAYVTLGRWPQLRGMLQYRSHRANGGAAEIIEYKGTAEGSS